MSRTNEIGKLALGLAAVLALGACSSVYPLQRMAKRAADPASVRQDVSVDTSNRGGAQIRNLAWAGFSASFECGSDCPYSLEERKKLTREIADKSFIAFDRELRRAFGGERVILDTEATISHSAFKQEIRTDSFRTTVSRWIDKVGLSRSPQIQASAHSLKALNPSELGWSGGQGLAALGRALAVDGVLVGHLRVTADFQEGTRRLVITGPKVWVFSSTTAAPIAIAALRPRWHFEGSAESNSWAGIDEVASGFGARVASALDE